MKSRRKNDKGFSLIELIIAVAILVVLSGLLAPQLIKYVERSRESKDMQTLDSVYVAVNTALANEDAYQAFVTASEKTTGYAAGIKNGVVATGLIGDTDDFTKEMASILGSSDKIKLISKRALGTGGKGVVCVQVQTEKDASTGVSGLEVGVYAGAEGGTASDPTFVIGNFVKK